MTDKTENTLEYCFERFVALHGRNIRCADFLPSVPRDPGPVNLSDISHICKKLGFNVMSVTATVAGLRRRATPCIMLMKNNGAYLRLPGQEIPAHVENSFSGHVLEITMPHEGAVDTRHFHHGHALDWFWKPLLEFTPRYVDVIVISVFINIFAIALPVYTMNVYDRVIPNFAQSTLIALSVGILLAIFFDFLLKTMRSYILEHVAAHTAANFDTVLLERFFSTSPASLTLSIGEKVNIFRELQGVRDFYSSRLVPAVVDLPFSLLFMTAIYMISPPLVWVPVTAAVVIMLTNLFVQIPIKRATRQSFEAQQAKTFVLFEMLAGIETIRMFNAMGNRLMRWAATTESSTAYARRNQFLLTATGNFSLMMTYLVNVFIVIVGVYCIHQGILSVGGLVAATILAGRAIAPFVNIAGVISRMKETNDVLRAIDGIFQAGELERKRVTSITNTAMPHRMAGKIEFRNVNFSYPKQPDFALSDISATILPKQKVGLLGKSGSGKSTFTRLITQALAPASGSVLLDDQFIESIHPVILNRNIAVVPQRSFFFSGTVQDNIVLGDPEIDQARLEQAAALSGLDVLLRQSGAGFNTQVGENGGYLSGGLQQAIALARVFARDPAIVIFDEPLTGIDHTLESRIKESMKFFLQNRTFIMITHRTTLLALVDRLIFLDQGRVATEGPRDEVMRKISGQG
ncbi:MAG: ATP-binding cassette domain-containing protein [Alphaproteobacteria bacterium PRO2]|nr:ATP-binding cassette domain-containing protein [Alphaproteobacteria bacterium PRO2]